ncbi:MAG: C25 family cysteine peptidase [Phycisphaerae bacterium]|nr:C25 family cysteine peptidase [Phycisphaerae bacterium]
MPSRRWILWAAVLLGAAVCLGQSAPASAPTDARDLYLLVTRPMFVEALAPWVQRRQAEGFRAAVSTEPVEAAIRSAGARPAMILLVGDDGGSEQADAPWSLPARRAPFYRWRATQAELMPTDAMYGDLDGDGLPDIPVGRLPVRTAAQAAAIVAKILAYEDAPPKAEDLTIPLWAGTAGVGPQMDAVAEAMIWQTLETSTPPWMEPWVIFGRAGSALCHWPPEQGRAFEAQFRRGGAFLYLIGHGDRREFHSMEFAGRAISYDAGSAAASLRQGRPAGPMLILACYCGDFTGADDCLAEALLEAPAGPVAVIAATTESHPLPNFFSSQATVAELARGPRRLGDFWLASQQAAYRAQNPMMEALLAEIEGTLEATINVGRLRRDQLLLYALLGDPATRLKLPQPLHGRLTGRDGRWHWQINTPADAEVLIVSFRAPLPTQPAAPPTTAPADRASAESGHRTANAAFAFQPLGTLSKDQRWEGTCQGPGVLRLVAVGGHTVYAVGLRLTGPASAPGMGAP